MQCLIKFPHIPKFWIQQLELGSLVFQCVWRSSAETCPLFLMGAFLGLGTFGSFTSTSTLAGSFTTSGGLLPDASPCTGSEGWGAGISWDCGCFCFLVARFGATFFRLPSVVCPSSLLNFTCSIFHLNKYLWIIHSVVFVKRFLKKIQKKNTRFDLPIAFWSAFAISLSLVGSPALATNAFTWSCPKRRILLGTFSKKLSPIRSPSFRLQCCIQGSCARKQWLAHLTSSVAV